MQAVCNGFCVCESSQMRFKESYGGLFGSSMSSFVFLGESPRLRLGGGAARFPGQETLEGGDRFIQRP